MSILLVPFVPISYAFDMKADEPRQNRIPFMMSDSELASIDDWRFANKIGTRAEAIRRLCQIAIALEPMVGELHGLWEELVRVQMGISREILDAKFPDDDEALLNDARIEGVESAAKSLSPALWDLAFHTDGMAKVLQSVKSGETIEDSVKAMKAKVKESREMREFSKTMLTPKKRP